MSTETKNIPVTPFSQLIYRFKAKNPSFFNWLAERSIYFSIISSALPWIVQVLLPILELPVPGWLSYSNRVVLGLTTLLAGAGLGSVFAAQTALTSAAPPIITDEKDELIKTVAQLQAKLSQLEANQQPLERTP